MAAAMGRRTGSFSLPVVVLIFILAYLVLAGRGEQHGFFDESWQEILFERDGRKLLTKCETVVFRRKGRE